MIIIRVSELNRILVSYETIDSSSNQGNYKVIFCYRSYIISDETKHKISGVVKMNMSDHFAVFTILSFKQERFQPRTLICRNYSNFNIDSFLNDLDNCHTLL